jgi:hypothetical protein
MGSSVLKFDAKNRIVKNYNSTALAEAAIRLAAAIVAGTFESNRYLDNRMVLQCRRMDALGLVHTFSYNARLQPTSIAAGLQLTLGLIWNNNGTLQTQAITRPGLSATQTYGYDGVNRLTSRWRVGTGIRRTI